MNIARYHIEMDYIDTENSSVRRPALIIYGPDGITELLRVSVDDAAQCLVSQFSPDRTISETDLERERISRTEALGTY